MFRLDRSRVRSEKPMEDVPMSRMEIEESMQVWKPAEVYKISSEEIQYLKNRLSMDIHLNGWQASNAYRHLRKYMKYL
jgi:hypothetical protein